MDITKIKKTIQWFIQTQTWMNSNETSMKLQNTIIIHIISINMLMNKYKYDLYYVTQGLIPCHWNNKDLRNNGIFFFKMSKLMTWIWKFMWLILKPDDLKYLQKPNLDVTKPKLLHLYSNMTHTQESIWTTPHTICDMQPNDIEINKKKT
jgi:hypothetical protein